MAGSSKHESDSDNENENISIGILGQDGYKVMFRCRRYVPLRKLLMKYCETKKLDYASMRFVYKERRVPVRRTPDELHMKDNALIIALVEMHSG